MWTYSTTYNCITRFVKKRKGNDNLEQQAQALYKSWFVDFEPFKDGKFVDSELGRIPEGWRVGKLSDVGKIIGGSTPSKSHPEYYTSEGIAWLTPKDLSITHAKFTSRGEVDITEKGYDSCSTKLLPKGSVLFSSRAPIGYLSIASNKICTNQGFKSIVPHAEIGTPFIYYYLKTNTVEIESKASGSTFKEASGTLMNSLPVVIPELKTLCNFNEILNPLFEIQEKNEAKNRKLSQLRDSILPKLMSGELKISDLHS
ncbi:restriction endonuclease subunit S [Bacteroides sp. 51]|uniref:restriction endonuclease subunit S n=1 Tax=Bacteroides sp. 51 TaxID=2302938 RepID=UPI0013D28A1E|nr:restriction endonuclease subunit S [Bacteroides sp. 51]NDV80911.1 restriction endonuclease subunit S [Bacteroides sp. 51]